MKPLKVTTWEPKRGKHIYQYKHFQQSVQVLRSDGVEATFCVGDEFTTWKGKEMVIESFFETDKGIYGKGSGTDISLANQLNKLND